MMMMKDLGLRITVAGAVAGAVAGVFEGGAGAIALIRAAPLQAAVKESGEGGGTTAPHTGRPRPALMELPQRGNRPTTSSLRSLHSLSALQKSIRHSSL